MTKTPSSKIPSYRKVTATQLAPIIGVSISRVSHLLHHGLPRLEDSKLFDLVEVVPWLVQRALEKGDVAGSGSARQLYFEAMTEKATLESEKLRGNLYGREEVNQYIMSLCVIMRAHVLALPERVTRDRTIAAQIERENESALEELATAVAEWTATREPGEVITESAAAPKRRRVGRGKQKDAAGKPVTRKVQARKRAVSASRT